MEKQCRAPPITYGVFLLALLIPSLAGAAAATLLSEAAGQEWPLAGADWNNTRFSSLSQITPQNIHQLHAAWVSQKFDEGGTSRVTPIVHGGVLFVTAGRKVYALDARTGARLWSYKTIPDPPTGSARRETELGPPDGVPNSRGVGVGGGMVFVGLRGGHVIALDEKTGTLRWSRQTGSEQPQKGQMAAVPPLYVNGSLLTGLSNGDDYVRGRLTALAAQTGNELWKFYPVPAPGEPGHETWLSNNDAWKSGGGGVWSTLAVDPQLGLVYATTGNAVPMYGGDWRPGDNLYTCSVVAVDLVTGKLRWHYQLVHHDVFDADIGTPVVLFDLKVGGATHSAIAALRSDGYLFELDRQTGRPLLPIEERAVPQLASQRTSPTQPFPVGGESLLMSCEDWRRQKLPSGFVLGCMWTAPAGPGDPQNVLAPFPAVRVTPMAYSPLTGYFYAQGTSLLTWPRRSLDPFFFDFSSTVPGLKGYQQLVAFDSRTGKIAWRASIPAAIDHSLPVHFSGGPTVTAGGLLFQSLGDGNVVGFDAGSGSVLWRFQTGMAGESGAAVSYEIEGQQYLAIPMGGAVWAFKLGGKILPAAPPPAGPPEEEFAGPVVDTAQIETTSLVTTVAGGAAHYFVDESAFHPYRAHVTIGAPITFVNNGAVSHEVVAVDGSWGTGPLSPTQQVAVRFTKAGHYPFHCKEHPWVYGELVVEPAVAAAASRGVMTFSQQAQQGRTQFTRHCSACHGDDLAGRATAPALAGATFLLHWRKASGGDLYDRIRTTMPQGQPGTLDHQTYRDIVAYLQSVNHLKSEAQ